MTLPHSCPGYRLRAPPAPRRAKASPPARRSAAPPPCADWPSHRGDELVLTPEKGDPSRSLPSVSHSPFRPTKRSATSAAPATRAASAMASSPSGRPMPAWKALKVNASAGLAASSATTACGRPAVSSTVPTTSSHPSSKKVRPRVQPLQASATPTRCAPLSAGMKRPPIRVEKRAGSTLPPPSGLPTQKACASPWTTGPERSAESENSAVSSPVRSGSKRALPQPSA